MSKLEEDKRRLANLPNSSRELAEKAFRAAAQLEAQADAMGLKYKERRAAAAPFSDAPDYRGNPQTGIGAVMGSGK